MARRPTHDAPGLGLTRSDKVRLTRLSRVLLNWFGSGGRDFPWRNPTASVYQRICVEVLLQRTRAESVAAVYEPFFKRFPSWGALAQAGSSELEDVLRPIGLWRRRAAALAGLARYAVAQGGLFPANRCELEDVPAVGQYVASAVLLFQHGMREPLLDANMARVIERAVRPRRLADIRHDPWLQSAARWLVRHGDAACVNWAVLDLAAVHCRVQAPRCTSCPAAQACSTGRAAIAGADSRARTSPRPPRQRLVDPKLPAGVDSSTASPDEGS